jgi:hypothetical protein
MLFTSWSLVPFLKAIAFTSVFTDRDVFGTLRFADVYSVTAVKIQR